MRQGTDRPSLPDTVKPPHESRADDGPHARGSKIRPAARGRQATARVPNPRMAPSRLLLHLGRQPPGAWQRTRLLARMAATSLQRRRSPRSRSTVGSRRCRGSTVTSPRRCSSGAWRMTMQGSDTSCQNVLRIGRMLLGGPRPAGSGRGRGLHGQSLDHDEPCLQACDFTLEIRESLLEFDALADLVVE